jgi:hypothetical protein
MVETHSLVLVLYRHDRRQKTKTRDERRNEKSGSEKVARKTLTLISIVLVASEMSNSFLPLAIPRLLEHASVLFSELSKPTIETRLRVIPYAPAAFRTLNLGRIQRSTLLSTLLLHC